MIISDIKYKKSGSAVVTVEGESFEINADDVFTLELKKGDSLSEDALFVLRESADYYFAYKKAAAAIYAGDISAKALYKRLKEKGATDSAAEKAVEKMRELGFVNEENYAERLCNTYGNIKHFGRHRVMQELLAHGVDRYAAEDAIEALPPDSENIAEFYAQKLSRLDPQDRKVISTLLRAGYNYETINSFLNDLNG